jgi:hypothetical protein
MSRNHVRKALNILSFGFIGLLSFGAIGMLVAGPDYYARPMNTLEHYIFVPLALIVFVHILVNWRDRGGENESQ